MSVRLKTATFFSLLLVLFHADSVLSNVPIEGTLTIGGKPFKDGEVRLHPIVDRHRLGQLQAEALAVPPAVAETRTDANGRFRLQAPDIGLWTVRVEAAGSLPREFPIYPLIDAIELPAVQLPPAAWLEVRVLDPEGRALQAAVTIRQPPPLPETDPVTRLAPRPGVWQAPLAITNTDADGRARLPLDETEDWTITIVAEGYLPLRQTGHGRRPLNFRLEAGQPQILRAVAGRLPIADALIFSEDSSIPIAVTGHDGTATLVVPDDRPLNLTLIGPDGSHGFHELTPWHQTANKTPETVHMPPPQRWTGRVIDRRSGDPIRGALVWLQDPRSGEFAITGPRGDYDLSTAERSTLFFAAAATQYTSTGASSTPSHDGAGPTLALTPAASLGGRVVDPDHRAIVDAEVTVTEVPGSRREALPVVSTDDDRRVHSSSRGHFTFSRLPAVARYLVRAEKAGFAPVELTLGPLEPFEERTDIRLTLSRGVEGTGWVIDEEDQPVVGAEVRLIPTPESGSHAWSAVPQGPSHSTGTDGRFTIPDLAAGRYSLEIKAAGFAPVSVAGIDVATDEHTIDLGTVILQPGAMIEGRVVDTRGRPLPEAEVWVVRADEATSSLARLAASNEVPATTSDVEGRFVVLDQPPGARVHLLVTKEGYARSEITGVSISEDVPLLVSLRPIAKISGEVVDAGRRPIAGAWISVRSQQKASAARSFASSEEGLFEIEAEPGTVTVTATAPGFQELRIDGLEVAAGEDLSDLRLTLEKGTTVHGTVRDPQGDPIAGVLVAVTDPGADSALGSEAFGRTDFEGRFELVGVGIGPRRLTAEDDNARRAVRQVEITPGNQTVDLVLEQGVEVSGWLRDGSGRPVEGAAVLLQATSHGRVDGGVAQADTLADGSFVFPDVSSGSYSLVAVKEGYAMGRHPEAIAVEDSPLFGLEIEVDSGITLRGQLLGLDFEDFERVVVRAYGKGGTGVVVKIGHVDYSGRFAVHHLESGELEVVADIPGTRRQARASLELTHGTGEAFLDLEFADSSR